jgi:hypothetical protein
MKNIFFILCLSSIAFTSAAQGDKVDSLIQKTDNKNIYGTGHWVWELMIHCEACESLIRIGEPATTRLIEKLQTTDKGIIAHVILSNTWLKELRGDSSSFLYFSYKKDSLVEYNYAGLTFYEGKKGIFAKQEDLIKNKSEWLLRIKQQNQPAKYRIRKKRAKRMKQKREREKAVPDL